MPSTPVHTDTFSLTPQRSIQPGCNVQGQMGDQCTIDLSVQNIARFSFTADWIGEFFCTNLARGLEAPKTQSTKDKDSTHISFFERPVS